MNRLKAAATLAAVTAVLAVPAVGQAAGSSSSTSVALTPLTTSEVNHLIHGYLKVDFTQQQLAWALNYYAETHGDSYPEGAALRARLVKLSKGLNGKIKLGAVPSPAKAKEGDFYVGASTRKVFRVTSVYRYEGHELVIGFALNRKGKIVRHSIGGDVWFLGEAVLEYAENQDSNIARQQARTAASASSSKPAYLTGAALVKYLNTHGAAGPKMSSAADPGVGTAKLKTFYLGDTSAEQFAESAYFGYSRKGWELDVNCTRGLTGAPNFTVTAEKK